MNSSSYSKKQKQVFLRKQVKEIPARINKSAQHEQKHWNIYLSRFHCIKKNIWEKQIKSDRTISTGMQSHEKKKAKSLVKLKTLAK